MKLKNYIKIIAIFLTFLIISLPITLAQEINYVTDANGNLVTGDSFYREYNELNQLIRIRQGNISTGPILEEYEWHPTEERILIKDVFSNGIKNYTIYYVSKEYIIIENSTGNYTEEYIYQDGTLVAQVNTDGQKQAIHSDHEGSNTLITDSSGSVIENTLFSPYGEILSGGKSSRFGTEGKEYDSLVDDVDFHFRKYNPKIPILHQPDDRIRVYDPQSLNRYSFERNNPVNKVDKDGHVWQLLIPGIVGAAIATGAYLLTHDDWSFGQGLEYAEAGFIGATIGTYGGILGASGGAVISQGLINDAENRPLNENLKEAAMIGAFTFGIGEVFLPAINPRNLKYLQSYFSTKTGQNILGREFTLGVLEWGLGAQNRATINNINRYAYEVNQARENLIQQMRQEGSSRAVFGSSGGSGFVSGIGYVTSGGRTYPTTNPNFRPNPNAPRVCISGC